MMPVLDFISQSIHEFSLFSVAFRVILAALLGGLIGGERGRHGRAAGMRTHVLVCVGSAMTSIVGLYVAMELGFSNDPLRVGAQAISGIGFLGVGTILTRNNTHVTGLTTAAGLWATASIGLCIGVGFYTAVLVAFVVVVFTMTILAKLETERKSREELAYYIEINDIHRVNALYEVLAQYPRAEIQILPARSSLPGNVGLEVVLPGSRSSHEEIIQGIRKECYVLLMVPIMR